LFSEHRREFPNPLPPEMANFVRILAFDVNQIHCRRSRIIVRGVLIELTPGGSNEK
jgi:hypothetical protein